jgi:hypothetical protein
VPSSSWRTQGETGHGARWPPVPGPRMALCKWVVSSAIKRGHGEGTSILCFARRPHPSWLAAAPTGQPSMLWVMATAFCGLRLTALEVLTCELEGETP